MPSFIRHRQRHWRRCTWWRWRWAETIKLPKDRSFYPIITVKMRLFKLLVCTFFYIGRVMFISFCFMWCSDCSSMLLVATKALAFAHNKAVHLTTREVHFLSSILASVSSPRVSWVTCLKVGLLTLTRHPLFSLVTLSLLVCSIMALVIRRSNIVGLTISLLLQVLL